MRGRACGEGPRDAAGVIEALERAGATLLSLPERGPYLGWRACSEELRRGLAAQAASARALRRTPSPAEISAMDAALAWLAFIPDERRVLRRIVASRCLVSPATGRHLFSWRRIGALIGADHHAVQRWHAQGIACILQGLAAAEGGRRAA